MKVYEKVRACIDAKGLTQETVAKEAGISTAAFCAIMSGRKKLYIDDLRAICLVLNVSPELFISPHEPEQKDDTVRV